MVNLNYDFNFIFQKKKTTINFVKNVFNPNQRLFFIKTKLAYLYNEENQFNFKRYKYFLKHNLFLLRKIFLLKLKRKKNKLHLAKRFSIQSIPFKKIKSNKRSKNDFILDIVIKYNIKLLIKSFIFIFHVYKLSINTRILKQNLNQKRLKLFFRQKKLRVKGFYRYKLLKKKLLLLLMWLKYFNFKDGIL